MSVRSNQFRKVKQVILRGKTLVMFEADCKDREEKESTLLREIVNKHYKENPFTRFEK